MTNHRRKILVFAALLALSANLAMADTTIPSSGVEQDTKKPLHFFSSWLPWSPDGWFAKHRKKSPISAQPPAPAAAAPDSQRNRLILLPDRQGDGTRETTTKTFLYIWQRPPMTGTGGDQLAQGNSVPGDPTRCGGRARSSDQQNETNPGALKLRLPTDMSVGMCVPF